MSRVYCEHYHPIDEGFGDCPECTREADEAMSRLVKFKAAADALAAEADRHSCEAHTAVADEGTTHCGMCEALARYREGEKNLR